MRHASKRHALTAGLAVPLAVAATALAGAAPAAAAARGSAAPACTVTWTGGGAKFLWNIARNWSTGRVPGPASDVCISAFVIVTANGPVSIHALHLGSEATVVFAGTASQPSHVVIATTLGNLGNVELDNSSLSAPQVDNGNGIESQGTSVLTSPALRNNGDVLALAGSLTLPDRLDQLVNGILNGGSWAALDNGVLQLPGDITTVGSGQVSIGAGSAIHDQAGGNALTGLTLVGPQATFALGSGSLTLSSLVSYGNLEIGSYDSGATLAVAGTLTAVQGSMTMQSNSAVRAATVKIDRGASLSALGTIDGNLVSDGSVGPAYHLAVTGSYTQGPDGTLAAGFVPELNVTGKATLAGALVAGEAPPPTPGARGTAITFGSVSGAFTSHNLGFNLVSLPHQIDVVAQPQIAASPASVARGASTTVTGGDFGLGSGVTIFLDKNGGTVLGTATASDQGDFSATVTIPWIAPGTHTIVAVGADGRQAQTTITVS